MGIRFTGGGSGGGGGGAPANDPAFQVLSGSDYTCPGTVSVRDAVYSTGADSVDRANATSAGKTPVIGFVTAKADATHATLIISGELGGFAGLTPGAVYFLNTANGAITTTAPNTAGNVVQRVGVARNATTLDVEIDPTLTVL